MQRVVSAARPLVNAAQESDALGVAAVAMSCMLRMLRVTDHAACMQRRWHIRANKAAPHQPAHIKGIQQ
jgi:hypothetical protein